MTHSNKVLTNLFLVLFSIMLTAGLLEGLVRFFGLAYTPSRFLMFSTLPYEQEARKAVRYRPDQTMRAIALYDDVVEYDVRFKTNNLGFVDTQDYASTTGRREGYYAFVGDSFTAGFHAGAPWVAALRERVQAQRDVEIYNLGVSGTGIKHFPRLVQNVSEQLPLTHVVIIGITDDFYRPLWYPLEQDAEIRFCREFMTAEACGQAAYIARIIPLAATQADIAQAQREMAASGEQYAGNIDPAERSFLERSHLWVLITKSWDNIFNATRDEDKYMLTNPAVNASLTALENMRAAHPDLTITFIHIPQKEEVIGGRYLLNPAVPLEEMGIAYLPALSDCTWSRAMFYEYDNHPNASGYQALADCVVGYVFDTPVD